jgi:CBS domain containing-hemolysin-like protein
VIALLALSVMDVALTAVNKVSVRRLLDSERFKFAPALSDMVEDRIEVLMALHILIQLVLVAGSVIVFSSFERRLIPFAAGVAGTIAVMLAIILVFRHLVPRLFVGRTPEMWLIRMFPLLKLCHLLMRPFARLLTSVLNYFHKWEEQMEPAKEEEASEEEIQAFIDAGQEEGILEREEGEMIQSIVHFGEKIAREVMTPRTQIIAADINLPIDKLLQLVTSKGKSRIPVYRDDLDNIEGVIHERDLLRVWQRGEKVESLRPLVRPVHFIPETKPVDDLLNEMKQNGDQMILVVDEYGGISGLITLEDLVEEIVGDIHDAESSGEKIVEESPGVYIVPGGLDLGALNELLGSPFVEQTECTTVAGAVVELFGKLPAAGEKIEHQGVSVEVLDADRRRVHRLRMRVLAPKPGVR